MSRPERILIDLAAGRSLSGPVYNATVDSAIEHRMAGLLWTRAQNGEISVPHEVRGRLESLDLQAWARARMLELALSELSVAARDARVRLVLIKGLATATRWYPRPAERWAYDLDVVVHPGDVGGIEELVASIYPSHPLSGRLVDLAGRGHIQSIDLGVRDMPVDIHLDPFKLEIVSARHAVELWDHVEEVQISPDLRFLTFDTTISLLLHIVHLNKDSFRRLIGYADVARGMRQPDLDLHLLTDLAYREGIEVAVAQTLRAVAEDLELRLDVSSPGGRIRPWIWQRTWASEQRIVLPSAEVGRHRLFVMSLIARGRLWEAVKGWLRRLVPPRTLLDYYYPSSRQWYPVKLVAERLRRRLSRRAH